MTTGVFTLVLIKHFGEQTMVFFLKNGRISNAIQGGGGAEPPAL